MPVDFTSLLFYIFSGVLTLSALMVVGSKNPVHSVLFLILSFFNAAALFVLVGAEYVAMTLVIVYVGAVAVLFLFVVMMLDINFAELRAGFMRYLPLGLIIAVVLFVEFFALFNASFDASRMYLSNEMPRGPAEISNTLVIGNVLYTRYMFLFQIAGLILLVAMIGAIVLTLRHRTGVRRQNIRRQHNRQVNEGVRLVNVKPGEGV